MYQPLIDELQGHDNLGLLKSRIESFARTGENLKSLVENSPESANKYFEQLEETSKGPEMQIFYTELGAALCRPVLIALQVG